MYTYICIYTACYHHSQYLKHVFYTGALLDSQLRHIEALAAVPSHLQLLLGELQQVIQRLVVDLTVRRPESITQNWYEDLFGCMNRSIGLLAYMDVR